MRKKSYSLLYFALTMTILLLTACGRQEKPAEKPVEKPSPATAVFETSLGSFEVALRTEEAPITTGNFIKLVKSGFYNGVIFHRVIDGFMVQSGDPEGTGYGGPGYRIKDEFSPKLKHEGVGVLSMANSGPDTGGSQFFITLAPTPWLDGKHAVFGKVIKGMEVVKAIGKVKTDGKDKPLEPVTIKKLQIIQ